VEVKSFYLQGGKKFACAPSMFTASQSSTAVGRSVMPVEDLVDYRSSAGQDVSAIISPYLPRGDIIIFGDKDSGKTAVTLCAVLAWGYKFGHVVFCCPHVHRDKLKSPKTSSVAKYKIACRDGDRRS
jgi:hypothetical protein